MIKKYETSVFIRLPNGNGCSISVSFDNTFYDLATHLQHGSMHMPDTYRFVHQGKPVANYLMTLREAGVRSSDIIHVQPENEGPSQNRKVDVAFLLNGDKFIVNLALDDTVWSLKQAINNLIDLAPKEQILIFLGKKLKNQQTLRHYRVSADSLLSLVVQFEESRADEKEGHFYDKIELVNSVGSLMQKRSGLSGTTLFRSDSINKKNVEEMAPYQISIHERKEHLTIPRTFGDLFNSCRSNALKQSLTFEGNVFQSVGELKIPERMGSMQVEEVEEILIADEQISIGNDLQCLQHKVR